MKNAPLNILLGVALAASLVACSGMNARATTESGPAAGGAQAETYETPNYYYLFDDILVPNAMEHVAGDDFSFDTQQFKAGIQNFEGRVVFDDLMNFFQNNMIKDGWRKVSAVRSKKSILIFEKTNKAAIIELVDGFKAKATIFALEYKSGSASTSAKSGNPRGVPGPSAPSKSSFSEKDISN
ncbi:hypothetical protein SAMN04488503_1606 [Humidesulfovibrio mexicanus]|uniref:Lipoprotein n=1 Tax=Humidesulfovibrio mexicanus TaxID=147047 RepID=A0A238ZUX1_9BACT|nr:hypothetical protein [Humidesulfovibrio mexicanus]SNR86831.1 hypothetical protein SAMN04488503_1606 [Humidesulfovibrio mexicanus]